MEEFDILDIFSEQNLLTDQEKGRLKQISTELDEIWTVEETKIWQRSRDKNILEGDRNTAYFHALANQRRRKTSLAILEGPNGPVYEVKDMLSIASEYYKNLFGFEPRPHISLGGHFWDPQDLVTTKENQMLEQPFSEEEIKAAVFGSYAAGAPGQMASVSFSTKSFGILLKMISWPWCKISIVDVWMFADSTFPSLPSFLRNLMQRK